MLQDQWDHMKKKIEKVMNTIQIINDIIKIFVSEYSFTVKHELSLQ